ncbi:MAG: PIN domain-containing protein [Candidatus Aenigmatarchaeota archaeon]
MRIVIDTNVLISALIRDSVTRRIIVQSGWEFYYPESSLHEIRKHENMILEKSGLSENEYSKLLHIMFSYITIVPMEQYVSRLKEAEKLLTADPDDVVFLAAALQIEGSIIWSDDKDFDRQNVIKNLKTKDMMTLFYSK